MYINNIFIFNFDARKNYLKLISKYSLVYKNLKIISKFFCKSWKYNNSYKIVYIFKKI